ncbi:MAG: hypothetical protein P4M12_10240 [Gammaproteobacteria bacterium]|nr:hypothetical protein [Gammaproteobacteria bacterium]
MSAVRLKPNDMFKWALYNIGETIEGHCFSKPYDFSRKTDAKGHTFTFQNDGIKKSLHLISPLSDFEKIEMNRNEGTTPLKDVLPLLNLDLTNDVYIIPLAECRGSRRHWTLLIITNNNYYFFDPKSYWDLGWFYSLSLLENILAEIRQLPFHAQYTGLQGRFDDIHCGYFVGELIRQVVDALVNNNNNDLASFKFKIVEPGVLVKEFKELIKATHKEYIDEEDSEDDLDLDLDLDLEFESESHSSSSPQLAQIAPISSDVEESKEQAESQQVAAVFTPVLNKVSSSNLQNNEQKEQAEEKAPTNYTQQLNELIGDEKYWASKSKFSLSMPKGLREMQGKSFEDIKKIAYERANKRNLFYLFTAYNNRDKTTEKFYHTLKNANSLEELVNSYDFKAIMKEKNDFKVKKTPYIYERYTRNIQ